MPLLLLYSILWIQHHLSPWPCSSEITSENTGLRRMWVLSGFLCVPWVCITHVPSLGIQLSAFIQEMKPSPTRLPAAWGIGCALLAVLFLMPIRGLAHSKNSLNTYWVCVWADFSDNVDWIFYYKYFVYAIDIYIQFNSSYIFLRCRIDSLFFLFFGGGSN